MLANAKARSASETSGEFHLRALPLDFYQIPTANLIGLDLKNLSVAKSTFSSLVYFGLVWTLQTSVQIAIFAHVSSSWLGRAKWAMCIYRRKPRPISAKKDCKVLLRPTPEAIQMFNRSYANRLLPQRVGSFDPGGGVSGESWLIAITVPRSTCARTAWRRQRLRHLLIPRQFVVARLV
jgi:hypothetical protein